MGHKYKEIILDLSHILTSSEHNVMLFYYFSALGTLIAYKESCKKNDIEKEEEIKLTYHERCTLTRHYWCVVRFRVSIA